MDSYVGNYHKFYRGTNYLDEMKEVLSDAAKWVVDSLVAHYGADAHAKGNTPAPLVPENVPGYELGLRVMELQVVKPPPYRKVLSVIRNTPQTAGAVQHGVDDSKISWRDATVSYHNIWEDKHGTYEVTEADALYISDDSRYFGLYTESDEKSILREKIRYAYDRIDYFAPKPAAKVFSRFSIASPFSGYLPILYSLDLGEVYYLELSRLNLTKTGLSKGLCAQPGELIAANFITGETHIIASIAEIERPVFPFEVHYKTPLPPHSQRRCCCPPVGAGRCNAIAVEEHPCQTAAGLLLGRVYGAFRHLWPKELLQEHRARGEMRHGENGYSISRAAI